MSVRTTVKSIQDIMRQDVGVDGDAQRQEQEGWSARVIPRLACDLKNELPELKGFSEHNLGRMVAFFRAYPASREFLQQPVAKTGSKKKLPQPVAKIASTELLERIRAEALLR